MARRSQERWIAETIAWMLFENGAKEQADRLMLSVDGPTKRDLGGWSRRAVENLIVSVLANQKEQ